MTPSELTERKARSQPVTADAEGEAQAQAADPAQAPPDVQKTAAALEAYLATAPLKRSLYLLARKWCGDGNKKSLRVKAGLQGTDAQLYLKQMNKSNLERMLQYTVNSSAAAAPAAAAPAAAAPAAPPRRCRPRR